MSLLNNNNKQKGNKGNKGNKNQKGNSQSSKFIFKPEKGAGFSQKPHKAGGTRGS
ncbi:MAG TPA: hypothetical protein VET23_13475 [Chitinophagaceae bacterium]|nr:hypothetical protein [Chitinophagaceae bacterium]